MYKTALVLLLLLAFLSPEGYCQKKGKLPKVGDSLFVDKEYFIVKNKGKAYAACSCTATNSVQATLVCHEIGKKLLDALVSYELISGKWYMQGASIWYYDSGTKRSEGLYKKHKQTGNWKFYRENATIASEINFDIPDNPKIVHYWDEAGNEMTGKLSIDEEPVLPGGPDSLKAMFNRFSGYPTDAQAKGKSGLVKIRALLDKDGLVKKAIVIKSVYPSLDKAATEFVLSLPPFKPARQYNRQIMCWVIVPLNFKLVE